jgi:lipid II:glycine glycyltransferase (peptidoglycan interpeptide bridge formation enzyme)
MSEVTATEWDAFLSLHPDAHLLQTWPWGELKTAFGWEVARILSDPTHRASASVGAQALFRRLPLGLTFAYIPKGPVSGGRRGSTEDSNWEAFLHAVDAACRKRGCVFLKVEPDAWDAAAGRAASLPRGFQASPHSIQPARTLLVDLGGTEDEILCRMKQKTRYNIRLGMKKGVIVRPCADLGIFHLLMQATSRRDGFGVHSRDYYQRAYDLFHPRGMCEFFLAELDGLPLAALMVFAHGQRAWYLYGASADTHREFMPTYLLQWEAMRWARLQGCTTYDLWGVPDTSEEDLESNFTLRSDGLWGVYRFKRGFGGELHRAAGSWDRAYQPVLYQLYLLWLKVRKVEG